MVLILHFLVHEDHHFEVLAEAQGLCLVFFHNHGIVSSASFLVDCLLHVNQDL